MSFPPTLSDVCRSIVAAAGVVLAVVGGPSAIAEGPLELRKGDRIALVGNTFAERLQLFGNLETRLRAAYPDLGLSFRNLAWSADEITLQPRPLNFGPLEEHLAFQEIDVALLFFGANESVQGEAGLESFRRELRHFLTRVGQRSFSDSADPIRLALVSPIPQEPTEHGPRVDDRNRNLSLYGDAMATVAGEAAVAYLDLFDSFQAAMEAGDGPLTINGLHLSEAGDRLAAELLARAIVGGAVGDDAVTVVVGSPEGGVCSLASIPIGDADGSVRLQVPALVPGVWSTLR